MQPAPKAVVSSYYISIAFQWNAWKPVCSIPSKHSVGIKWIVLHVQGSPCLQLWSV